MLLRPANFLILDEPTNHLDIQSQEVLQNALRDYPGSYLIVSHNRSFLDPIVDKTLEFRQGQPPRMFAGNITYYIEKLEQEKNAEITSSAQNQASKNQQAKQEATAKNSASSKLLVASNALKS